MNKLSICLLCLINCFQGRMIAAPFFYVGFADFWLADQLNSLAVALLDFHFLTCFYLTNGDWLNAGGNVHSFDNSIIYIITAIRSDNLLFFSVQIQVNAWRKILLYDRL